MAEKSKSMEQLEREALEQYLTPLPIPPAWGPNPPGRGLTGSDILEDWSAREQYLTPLPTRSPEKVLAEGMDVPPVVSREGESPAWETPPAWEAEPVIKPGVPLELDLPGEFTGKSLAVRDMQEGYRVEAKSLQHFMDEYTQYQLAKNPSMPVADAESAASREARSLVMKAMQLNWLGQDEYSALNTDLATISDWRGKMMANLRERHPEVDEDRLKSLLRQRFAVPVNIGDSSLMPSNTAASLLVQSQQLARRRSSRSTRRR